MALICALLVAGLPGPGCAPAETLDRETDELLNKLNNPGHSSSGSASSTGSGTSGLAVIERDAMPKQMIKDARGRPVMLWGQAKSTSKTSGHDDTIAARAVDMVRSGKYEYVLMQRSWRTATTRVATSRRIPDLIGVRHDGKVDAFEVRSNSDNRDALMQRLEEGMNTLPADRRGRYDVFEAEP